MFNRTYHEREKNPTHKKSLTALSKNESVQDLLQLPKIKGLIDRIVVLCPQSSYTTCYQPLLHQFLLYCQTLPESTNIYYAEKGGLVEFALLRTEIALSLFSPYLLKEDDKLSEVQCCWQYALFSATLLYGIGKLFIDYQVDLYDKQGIYMKAWNPLLGDAMFSPFYTYKMSNQSDIYMRRRLNLMFAHMLMPKVGLDWLSQYPEIFEAWLALLEEETHGVRVLGAILFYADSLALMRAIEQFKLNTIKTKSFRTFEEGQPDNLNEKAGLQFLQWLKQQLEKGELVLNEANLPLDDEGLHLQDEVFIAFVRDFPAYKNFQAVKQGFSSLGFNDSSTNTAEVLFSRFGIILPEKARLSHPKIKQGQWTPALEIIDFAYNGIGRTEIGLAAKLNVKGQWVQQQVAAPLIKPGQSHRG